ncbi:MAG: hypothetical protein HY652_11185 [Acidobacteria bacterium]|nr:hypothetical protein [Acidobacteriota bacterium]
MMLVVALPAALPFSGTHIILSYSPPARQMPPAWTLDAQVGGELVSVSSATQLALEPALRSLVEGPTPVSTEELVHLFRSAANWERERWVQPPAEIDLVSSKSSVAGKLEPLEVERARELDQKGTVGFGKAVSHARRLIEDDEEVVPGTVTESQSKKEDQSPGLSVMLDESRGEPAVGEVEVDAAVENVGMKGALRKVDVVVLIGKLR